MQKLILIFNVLIIFLFWPVCLIIVEPAYNHFLQYGEQDSLLPVPTQLAINPRFFLLIVPVLWILLSYWVHKTIRAKQKEDQLQFLLLFLTVTISSGILMLVFFTLAGILPYLKIGAPG